GEWRLAQRRIGRPHARWPWQILSPAAQRTPATNRNTVCDRFIERRAVHAALSSRDHDEFGHGWMPAFPMQIRSIQEGRNHRSPISLLDQRIASTCGSYEACQRVGQCTYRAKVFSSFYWSVLLPAGLPEKLS